MDGNVRNQPQLSLTSIALHGAIPLTAFNHVKLLHNLLLARIPTGKILAKLVRRSTKRHKIETRMFLMISSSVKQIAN